MDPLKIILSIMLVTWAGIGVGYIDILIQRKKENGKMQEKKICMEACNEGNAYGQDTGNCG